MKTYYRTALAVLALLSVLGFLTAARDYVAVTGIEAECSSIMFPIGGGQYAPTGRMTVSYSEAAEELIPKELLTVNGDGMSANIFYPVNIRCELFSALGFPQGMDTIFVGTIEVVRGKDDSISIRGIDVFVFTFSKLLVAQDAPSPKVSGINYCFNGNDTKVELKTPKLSDVINPGSGSVFNYDDSPDPTMLLSGEEFVQKAQFAIHLLEEASSMNGDDSLFVYPPGKKSPLEQMWDKIFGPRPDPPFREIAVWFGGDDEPQIVDLRGQVTLVYRQTR